MVTECATQMGMSDVEVDDESEDVWDVVLCCQVNSSCHFERL